MDSYYLEAKDAEGNRLRIGDWVLVEDPASSYFGQIARNADFGQEMVLVRERRYGCGPWQSVGWKATMWLPLRHRKRYAFSRRMKGVYLKERYEQETGDLFPAPLPMA